MTNKIHVFCDFAEMDRVENNILEAGEEPESNFIDRFIYYVSDEDIENVGNKSLREDHNPSFCKANGGCC